MGTYIDGLLNNLYVDPYEYGAKGDGVTDDTDALNRAFAAALAGRTIVLKKQYVVYGTIDVNGASGIKIIGHGGASITQKSQNKKLLFIRNSTDVYVDGLTLKGYGLGDTSSTYNNALYSPSTGLLTSYADSRCIDVLDSTNVHITNCNLSQFRHAGVLIRRCSDVWIQNNKIRGLYPEDTGNGLGDIWYRAAITSITRVGSTVTAQTTFGQFGGVVTGLTMYVEITSANFSAGPKTLTNVTTSSISWTEAGAEVTEAPVNAFACKQDKGLRLGSTYFNNQGVHLDAVGGDNIKTPRWSNIIVSGNQITNVVLGVFSSPGYENLQIEGNKIEWTAQHGIYIYPTSGCSVKSNYVSHPGLHGIKLQGLTSQFEYQVENLTIQNNIVKNQLLPNTAIVVLVLEDKHNVSPNGIRTAMRWRGVKISGNTITHNVGNGIYITHCDGQISDNIISDGFSYGIELLAFNGNCSNNYIARTVRDAITSMGGIAKTTIMDGNTIDNCTKLPPAWKASTAYTYGDVVQKDGRTFAVIQSGVSGLTGPSGTGSVSPDQIYTPDPSHTDGSVKWRYLSEVADVSSVSYVTTSPDADPCVWISGNWYNQNTIIQNNGNVYISLNQGFAGATAPTAYASTVIPPQTSNDGNIVWQFLGSMGYKAWRLSTSYTLNTLVINNGSIYKCTTGGVSATSGFGPSGTGSGIVDGSCVWSYVDRGVQGWFVNTLYVVDCIIYNRGNIYKCTTGGTSALTGNGPSGTGTGITDGSCVWDFVGPIPYRGDFKLTNTKHILGLDDTAIYSYYTSNHPSIFYIRDNSFSATKPDGTRLPARVDCPIGWYEEEIGGGYNSAAFMNQGSFLGWPIPGKMCRDEIVDGAPPTTGYHHTGDRAWNRSPNFGGVLLWVCTALGTPGTWRAVYISQLVNPNNFGALYFITGNFPLAAGPTPNLIDYASKEYDAGGVGTEYVTTGANWKYTCPVTGIYHVDASLVWQPGSSTKTVNIMYIYRDGVVVRARNQRYGSVAYHNPTISADVICAAGAQLDIRVEIDSTETGRQTDANTAINRVSIHRVGDS